MLAVIMIVMERGIIAEQVAILMDLTAMVLLNA